MSAQFTEFGVINNIKEIILNKGKEIELRFDFVSVSINNGDLTVEYFAKGEKIPFAKELFYSIDPDDIKLNFFGSGTVKVGF
jgi:hypothetical protein